MKAVAWWSPLPPQGSGIADYSSRLLSELSEDFSITAVVAPGVEADVTAPAGIEILDADDYRASDFDLDVYHFGNHTDFHAYMHSQALDHPGLLVLHDPSLVDFYVNLSGGTRSAVYIEEIRFNCPENLPNWTSKRDPTWEELDRLELMLSKRLVDASLATIVHSPWAKRRLSMRSPDARIESSWLGADTIEAPSSSSPQVTFAVLGGISRHKRVLEVLEAFRGVVKVALGTSRLLIAGRVDDEAYFATLARFIAEHDLTSSVQLVSRLDDEDFDKALSSCDVLISLRWPTAGETSSVMMRAFGAGKVVVTSDVPQNRDFDQRFCRLVSLDLVDEQIELVATMSELARDPNGVREAGELAQRFIVDEASFSIVATRYRTVMNQLIDVRGATLERRGPVSSAVSDVDFSWQGVNAIGNWAAATGLAEAARRAVEALVAEEVPVSVENFATGVSEDKRRVSSIIASRPTGRAFATDLYFLNINELQLVTDEFMSDAGADRYKVGSWYWELPTVPPVFAAQLRRLDEVWVASEYVRQSFRGEVGVPIEVMPCIVEPGAASGLSRAALGLPADRFIFFFHFDANSTFARKNPFAVIRAFHAAFPRRSGNGPLLVIKTQNLSGLASARIMLEEAMESVGGLLIDGEVSAEEMLGLLGACDAYVSLHRAEGFGLGMAEAMYYGKPVIATGFSGNLEFCTAANSALVSYAVSQPDPIELSLNPGAEAVYGHGSVWVDPDVEQASHWMRVLYEDAETRSRLGALGARTIREGFNVRTAGRQMAARLREIGRGHTSDSFEGRAARRSAGARS